MAKVIIDGKELEVEAGTTIIRAALDAGIDIPHFCWHPDLPVDGNCRMCLVEIEKAPRLQIACNTVVQDGMVVLTRSEKAAQAHRTTLEFLLVNHPIDCPVCDQAGECYLQDQYMGHALHDSQVEIEEKVQKRKVVDLGPIMLDAERCVLCSRCIRFEREVTGTNSFEFRNRGDHTQIATFQDRPITHDYAGNLADVCPVGALLSHDFRFKMRVWFLEETSSVCPGCSTGCNIHVDHRDGEVRRLRPRRNVEVNRSWMCDPGRALHGSVGEGRLERARRREGDVAGELDLAAALDEVAARLRDAGKASAFVASPQASNEDLFAFRRLADAAGGLLDFRVGDPQDKLDVREDHVLQRADKNPNTQGCLDQGMGRDGLANLTTACREGRVEVLLLQGPELLLEPDLSEAVAAVPFVAVMATHDAPELNRAHVALPAAVWAETEGTFTNHARRVQRFRLAVPSVGDARPRWQLAAELLRRLEAPFDATSSRDVFGLLAAETAGYESLSHRILGNGGRALATAGAGVSA
jgi:NADH-quinone oxidoreductase subunit G